MTLHLQLFTLLFEMLRAHPPPNTSSPGHIFGASQSEWDVLEERASLQATASLCNPSSSAYPLDRAIQKSAALNDSDARQLPAWVPLDISCTHAVFLSEALANLDEYGRQQRELVSLRELVFNLQVAIKDRISVSDRLVTLHVRSGTLSGYSAPQALPHAAPWLHRWTGCWTE